MALLILQDVVVAVELAGDSGQIGYDGGQLAEVDLMEREGEVLQHRGVLILGVELQTGIVVGYQVHFRLYLLVSADEDEVVLVEVELLVAYRRTFWHQPQSQAVLFHIDGGSKTYAHLALVVVVAQSGHDAVLMEMAIDEGIEHELRILLVVAYLRLVAEPFLALVQVQADGVYAGGVVDERVDVTGAVDARFRRGGQINRQLFEVDAHRPEEVGYGILALALQMHFHDGEQGLDGRLVDDLVLILCHDGIGQY